MATLGHRQSRLAGYREKEKGLPVSRNSLVESGKSNWNHNFQFWRRCEHNASIGCFFCRMFTKDNSLKTIHRRFIGAVEACRALQHADDLKLKTLKWAKIILRKWFHSNRGAIAETGCLLSPENSKTYRANPRANGSSKQRNGLIVRTSYTKLSTTYSPHTHRTSQHALKIETQLRRAALETF